METKNAKRIYDACKEANDISQDIQKRQQIIGNDISEIDNALYANNLSAMANVIVYLVCKYPDIANFINPEQKHSLTMMIMTNAPSIALHQQALLMQRNALNGMMAGYRIYRIVSGKVKLDVQQAIESIIDRG